MVNYYEELWPTRSMIPSPTTMLTGKKSKFEWTDECQTTFLTMKKIMAQDLLLMYPSMKKIRYIYRRFQLSNWCCYYTERKTSSIFFAQIQPSVVPVHYYRKRTRSYSRNSEDLSTSAIRSGNPNFDPPQASTLPFNRIRT